MNVSQLWRHPVKSMMGERVESAEVVEQGMVGDRTWATRDEERGGIRGAKKIAGLMKLAAAHVDGPRSAVVITMPDGSTTTTDAADRDERVSNAIDHRVTLWPLRPADDLDHYRRGAPDSDDMLEELNGIFGREEGEPLPDLSVFPPEILEFESPPGTYLDAWPLLLMSTSALASLDEALPDSAIDVRRFRPNVVIDTGDATGHPEVHWVGRRIRVGEVEIEVNAGCPRCVMVTHEVDADIPADRRVLRHIVADLGQNVGVYGKVVTPGTITMGDPVLLM